MNRILFLILILFAGLATGQNAAEVLQGKLSALRTMSANFSQVIRAKTHVVSRSTGLMALQRPGKFRWDTKTPMAQLVVADSRHIWVYDVDLEQVTVKKQDKSLGGTPALFLSGCNDNIIRDFTVSETQQGKHELYDLHAKSNKDNFQRIKLDFMGESLHQIELFDQLGQRTTVQLSNIKNNLTLPSKLFTFNPPKGVDVVQQ